METLLLLIWLLCLPGVLAGIILTAVGKKTRKIGLITLITSVVLLLIIPPVCMGLGSGMDFR